MTADGHFLLFSSAKAITTAGSNGKAQLYERDLATGATRLVSAATDGAFGDGATFASSASNDGRYVAFASTSSNVVPGDTNGATDAFVRDMTTGTTERASVASDGSQANANNGSPGISADGRYVSFQSSATNITPAAPVPTIYVHDRTTGETDMVASTNGSSALGGGDLMISTGGRYVTYLAGGNNDYLRDRQTGTTQLLTQGLNGAPETAIHPARSSARMGAMCSSRATLPTS